MISVQNPGDVHAVAIEPLSGVRAMVLGDLMLDRYLYGATERLSPEAPVPIVAVGQERVCPGGAGNVAISLAALGCKATVAGSVGADSYGEQLVRAMASEGIDTSWVVASKAATTIRKTRVMVGDHHVLRLDRDGSRQPLETAMETRQAAIIELVAQQDVVVLADYNKGTLSEPFLRSVIERCRATGVPCLVDPKKPSFVAYSRATLLCPNVLESELAISRKLLDDAAVEHAARQLFTQLQLDYMLITRGAQGMTLADQAGTRHFPAQTSSARDVTGAGDTVVAVLAACLGNGTDIDTACHLAALAASITVRKPGVYAVSPGELRSVTRGQSPKVLDLPAAQRMIAAAQRHGQRVVFTNGCFDILHAGHLYCLERARALGDVLVIGLNSDISVKLNKGETRPIIDQEHRAALLAGLACVDAIVLFDELTPELLVRSLGPDVLVKGSDYQPSGIAGADFVTSRGGQVVTLPLLPGLSTTSILQRHAKRSHERV